MGEEGLTRPLLKKLLNPDGDEVRRQRVISLLSRRPSLRAAQSRAGANGDEVGDEMGVSKCEMQGDSPTEGVAHDCHRLRYRRGEKIGRIGHVGANGSVVSVAGQVHGDDVTRRCQEFSKVARRPS